jgi:hypothetical protein
MKIVPRQPICISRLKKKSEGSNIITINQCKDSRMENYEQNICKVYDNENPKLMDTLYKIHPKPTILK